MSELVPGIGDRVRVCLRDGSRLRARITALEGANLELVLATPSRPAGAAVAPADTVELCLYHQDAVYVHQASVRSRLEEGKLTLLLEPSPPQRLQRREYFRMPVRFSFLVRLRGRSLREAEGGLMEEDPSAPPAQWALFSLVNLSGGGCLCLDPKGLLRMDAVYEGRLHTGDEDPPLVLCVAVVRRTQMRGEEAAGLRFVGLKEKSRQRIMAALFREYRKVRAKRLHGDLRPPSAPRTAASD
jgi:c-di-GMP-binding flagellar brake protein YcgR